MGQVGVKKVGEKSPFLPWENRHVQEALSLPPPKTNMEPENDGF